MENQLYSGVKIKEIYDVFGIEIGRIRYVNCSGTNDEMFCISDVCNMISAEECLSKSTRKTAKKVDGTKLLYDYWSNIRSAIKRAKVKSERMVLMEHRDCISRPVQFELEYHYNKFKNSEFVESLRKIGKQERFQLLHSVHQLMEGDVEAGKEACEKWSKAGFTDNFLTSDISARYFGSLSLPVISMLICEMLKESPSSVQKQKPECEAIETAKAQEKPQETAKNEPSGIPSVVVSKATDGSVKIEINLK